MSISNICQLNFRNILQSVVSQFLYRKEINNMCGANTYLNELFLEDWRYVYRICLHHQPHNYEGLAIIDVAGVHLWYKEGRIHRDRDLPAIIHADGTQEWYKDGNIHRDGDQPAVIFANGRRDWFKEGTRHRDGNQPAVIYSNGYQQWVQNGNIRKL